MPAAPSRSPARPSPDREAKSAHIEARSELLSLIASHAAEELGDELGAAAMVDVALPPPKLALAEAAARKKAAADAEEERARRQAAVEKLADRVAKHNDTRARAPRSGDDAEVEPTSAAFRPRPPRRRIPDGPRCLSGAGPDDGGPERPRRRARLERRRARRINHGARGCDARDRRRGLHPPDPDARDAAARRENPNVERRKCMYIRESKARWKAKLAKEKADLRAAEQRRRSAQDGASVARGGARRRRATRHAGPRNRRRNFQVDATLSPERRENDAIETRGETTGWTVRLRVVRLRVVRLRVAL